ncbi:MAG TPA: flagellar biosynthesis protein FlhA [Oligoflexia bacterium]|nr:flagellar biosynthesis protein FlhA [Oligoflexia bacterium]HMP48799.1 flagellar biosynthesis protein FlhA [Oligoflexia bacterium]
MIIFPLPVWMLDVLLAANFAFCLVLLLSSLFISEPDRFTSLPSVLLLSTLFRLGLNISSTRAILSGVAVPDIILAFGGFVVGGSTIVGLVVFSIIAIVQFIVIAKGSERVAEVAARFTLDALPGKQMSIDADMRAGLLNLNEAREKRRELHRESKLYGALDGAMKFIKGDAIVGLCIIVVNILAGLLVGITRDGLGFAVAVERYTLFTIGDGLVSQIPAVLVSVAAGIVVTRVAEKEGGQLANEICGQLFRQPAVLFVTGILLWCLSLVPGLPFLPFIVIGLFPLVAWVFLLKSIKREASHQPDLPFVPRILPSFVLKLSPKGAMLLQQEESLSRYIELIRAEIFDSVGVYLPDLCFDIDPARHDTSAELLVNACPRGRLVFDSSDENLDTEIRDPWSRKVGRLIQSDIGKCISEFVDDAHTRALLDLYEPYHVDVINAIIPEKMSVTTLTLVLRGLVEEDVSIREFANLLQGLAEYYQSENGARVNGSREVDLAIKAVRKRLVPKSIARKYTSDSPLEVFVLDSTSEEKLFSFIEAELPIHHDFAEAIRNSLEEWIEDSSKVHHVLSHSGMRSSLSSIFRTLSFKCMVLSHEEIPSSIKVKVVGVIGVSEKKEYEAAA